MIFFVGAAFSCDNGRNPKMVIAAESRSHGKAAIKDAALKANRGYPALKTAGCKRKQKPLPWKSRFIGNLSFPDNRMVAF
jgi:hypothetical protein